MVPASSASRALLWYVNYLNSYRNGYITTAFVSVNEAEMNEIWTLSGINRIVLALMGAGALTK
jgi:hypothetical protein